MSDAAPAIVLDTSVLVSALRSRAGASYWLLTAAEAGRVKLEVSPKLALEYESKLAEFADHPAMRNMDRSRLLADLARLARRRYVDFLLRPASRDPDDDHVLELAFVAGCPLVTHNLRDFEGPAARWGVQVWTPSEAVRALTMRP